MSYTVNAITTRNICGNFALEQVVSHHAPSSRSVHPRYVRDLLTPASRPDWFAAF
jgi:hypothetical protein